MTNKCSALNRSDFSKTAKSLMQEICKQSQLVEESNDAGSLDSYGYHVGFVKLAYQELFDMLDQQVKMLSAQMVVISQTRGSQFFLSSVG